MVSERIVKVKIWPLGQTPSMMHPVRSMLARGTSFYFHDGYCYIIAWGGYVFRVEVEKFGPIKIEPPHVSEIEHRVSLLLTTSLVSLIKLESYR